MSCSHKNCHEVSPAREGEGLQGVAIDGKA